VFQNGGREAGRRPRPLPLKEDRNTDKHLRLANGQRWTVRSLEGEACEAFLALASIHQVGGGLVDNQICV
jgi:hypothetical protein